MWTFIRHLKDEEVKTRRTLRAAERGDAPPTPRRRLRMLEDRINRVKLDYRRGRRNIDSYWSAVAHAIHKFQ